MSFDNILGRPAEPTTEKTVWRKAAEAIQQRGWTQGSAETRDGCLCVGGALAVALGFDPSDMWDAKKYPEMARTFSRFGDYVGAYDFYDTATRVYIYNDAQNRTKDHVLKKLEELDELERASK